MVRKENSWRDELDMLIEQNLKEIIIETKEHDFAIKKSKNKGKAQIWVAIALLNNKINKLLAEKNTYSKKLEKKELANIIKTLEKL